MKRRTRDGNRDSRSGLGWPMPWLGPPMKPPTSSPDSYRLLFERVPLGIFHFDEGGVLRACNPALLELLGAPAEALQDFDTLAGVANPGILSAIREALEGQEGQYEGPYTSLSSGRTFMVRLSTFPLRGPDGTPQGGLGIGEDITERTRAQAEVHHLQSLLKASV